MISQNTVRRAARGEEAAGLTGGALRLRGRFPLRHRTYWIHEEPEKGCGAVITVLPAVADDPKICTGSSGTIRQGLAIRRDVCMWWCPGGRSGGKPRAELPQRCERARTGGGWAQTA